MESSLLAHVERALRCVLALATVGSPTVARAALANERVER
jgi:hypothetical protein